MTRKFILIISSILLMHTGADAQYDNVWAFGDSAGVDFNTNPPTAITTHLNTREGCASICDSNGRLLFYTDGDQVWDRNHQVMANSGNLPGSNENITSSTAQGTLIVPMPGNPAKYYVFSLGMRESPVFYGRLFYSIVDMSLNNGLGDIDVNYKGMLLDSGLMEGMIAVSGNDCNIWLLAPAKDTVIKAYNINLAGIDTPLCSYRVWTAPSLRPSYYATNYIGCLNVSSDRSRLVIAEGDVLVVYDFDPESGKVSNPFALRKGDRTTLFRCEYFSAAFSEDNTKLYVSDQRLFEGGLMQFDLGAGDSLAIINSKMVFDEGIYGVLRMGPDGRIYVPRLDSSFLAVINKPNLKGAACVFEKDGFVLKPGSSSLLGLPNIAVIVIKRKQRQTLNDTIFCFNSTTLKASRTSGVNYKWDDGSSDSSREVKQPGIYWVSYEVSSPCMFDECVDTFHVVADFSIRNQYTTTLDTGLCSADTLLMTASQLRGTNYIWEDGSTDRERKVNERGIYWLHYQIDSLCESHIDSFIVYYPDNKVSFSADTLICQQDTLFFTNTSVGNFNQFDWSFGDGHISADRNVVHGYAGPGRYYTQLVGRINDICLDTFSQMIIVDPKLDAYFAMDKDSICMGELVLFSHKMKDPGITDVYWQMGDGQEFSNVDTKFPHAYDHSGIMDVVLKAQFRVCPESSYTNKVYVFAPPRVYLGPDTFLCLKGAPIVLRNLYLTPATEQHYLWNTGDTTAMLKVTHPGIYSVTLSEAPQGCSTTETVEVKKGCFTDIPNAFTPNGDGINDYFFPRQLLSRHITSFKMQVFDRWGQVVFETVEPDGRGWDGTCNAIQQSTGVYVYLIEFAAGERMVKEKYKGNITLLR